MLLKCKVCGEHVPTEVAVEIPRAGGIERYCSLRCAEEAEAQAGAGAPTPALPEPPRRILVAVDGSGPSLRATEMAASLARLSGASVTLLHAIDPALLRRPAPGGAGAERALREDAEAQLARCRRVCEGSGVPVTMRIEVEVPARAVSAAAAGADLVVMGTRGLGAVSGQAVGSLSQRVLGETRTPVLVIH